MWYWLCRKPAKIVDREWGRGRLSVRDSVRELYATEDCNLSFLGLRHLCALQAFSPGIFGGRISELWAGLLSRCLPSHRSSTMSASRQHWAMHLQLPIPPPTRGPHAYPCSRTKRLELKNKTRLFIWDLVQDFILFWDVSWTCSSRSLSRGLDLLPSFGDLNQDLVPDLDQSIECNTNPLSLCFYLFIHFPLPPTCFFLDQKHNLQENGQFGQPISHVWIWLTTLLLTKKIQKKNYFLGQHILRKILKNYTHSKKNENH